MNRGLTDLTFSDASGGTVIIRGVQLDIAEQYGITPLHIAVLDGHVGAVQILLASGARPNIPDVDGITPLTIAANGGNTEMVSTLLANGARLDLSPDALVDAAHDGKLELVLILLANGAQINTPGSNGNTPLETAIYKGHLAIVCALLASRAQVSPDAIELAAEKGRLDIVQVLLDSGAQVSPDAIELAAEKGHLDIVQVLQAHCARLGQAPGTPVDTAHYGQPEVVQPQINHIPPPQQPASLADWCRSSIRGRLVERLDCSGQPLKQAVNLLPLPAEIKSYVYHPLSL